MNHVLNSQKNTHDWHRADVIAALHKQGWSVASLARAHDLGESTLRSALDKPYPKSERLLAEAIGVAPEDIWPDRYAARQFKPKLRTM